MQSPFPHVVGGTRCKRKVGPELFECGKGLLFKALLQKQLCLGLKISQCNNIHYKHVFIIGLVRQSVFRQCEFRGTNCLTVQAIDVPIKSKHSWSFYLFEDLWWDSQALGFLRLRHQVRHLGFPLQSISPEPVERGGNWRVLEFEFNEGHLWLPDVHFGFFP